MKFEVTTSDLSDKGKHPLVVQPSIPPKTDQAEVQDPFTPLPRLDSGPRANPLRASMSIPDRTEAQPMNPWQMAVRMTLIESAALPKKPRSQSFVQQNSIEENKKEQRHDDAGSGRDINQVQI